MYLISRSASLTLPLRDRKVEYTPQGDVARVIPALSVQFQHAGYVPAYAQEAVKDLPNWGRGIGLNEDPLTRCGSLDTDVEAEAQGWSSEDKEFVENALRNASANGVEYIIVDQPKAAKPWPKYDDIVGDEAAEQIAWQVDQLGLSVNAVLAYERENEDRADVIAALVGLQAQQEDDVIGVISA